MFYKDIICAFDIETTNIPEEGLAFMYVWQFQIGDDTVVLGRSWEEFIELLLKLSENMRDNVYYVIYIHNASFEFSFIKGIYSFTEEEVFCIESRKILKFTMFDHFEFRCSYLQSNMSLDEFSKRYGQTKKESGKRFNYSKVRYPWTRLSRKERKYIINDVRALVEAMTNRIAQEGDNLYTVPLTSTGYVRRKVKAEMRSYSRDKLRALQPDEKILSMLLMAYRGGNTHSNRYMTGQIWENVHNVDIASSYPASQLTRKYPMSPFYYFTDSRNLTVDKVINRMVNNEAFLVRIAVWNIKLIDPMTAVPYIARHKCQNVINPIIDNGRICVAEYLETYMTDIDFGIFMKQYTFDSLEVMEMAVSDYDQLPSQILNVTRQLYYDKCRLKNTNDDLLYNHTKSLLNSIYGMSVSAVEFRPNYKLIKNEFVKDLDFNFSVAVDKANKKAFQSYAWGVWICAHSRNRLQRGIDEVVGNDDFIYCDTDSIKYIGEHDFSKLNDEFYEDAKRNNAIGIDKDGVKYPIGVYEYEKDYEYFRTWGAKKYCFVKNGKINITVAGVNKIKGAIELEKRGGIESFTQGFVFKEGGGTEAIYQDNYIAYRNIDGHKLRITDCCCIRDSEYTLGLTSEYIRILEHPALWLDYEYY